METAGFLTLGCEGRLDVVFSDCDPFDEKRAAERRRHLSHLVNEFRIGMEHQIVLEGDADDTLPIFAARQGYDMMILGALARPRGPAGLVGTVTSRLIDSLDCDFVLVKADAVAAEDEMAQPARVACA
jgi:nucleotide-binding universal stress UspA family protein